MNVDQDYMSEYQHHPLVSVDTDKVSQQHSSPFNIAAVATATDRNNISANAGDEFGQRSRSYYADQSHYIGMITSSPRTTVKQTNEAVISQMSAAPGAQLQEQSLVELHSHMDTSCVNANCRIILYTDKVCSVSPFHPKYKAMENIPIVQATTAYEDQDTGKKIILIFNQSLYMGDALTSSLLNLNQARTNGLTVDDVPCQFGGTHSILILRNGLRIPLQIQGVLSCIPVRKPSAEEVETCEWIELTAESEWNPKSTFMQEQELASQASDSIPTQRSSRYIYPITTMPKQQSFSVQHKPAELTMSICSAQTFDRRPNITAMALSKQWGIGLEAAPSAIS